MITCALPDMRSLSVAMPLDSSMSISSTSTCGSMTQPLPITGVTASYMMPLGMRCSASFVSPWMTVWPALLPPWKRTTKS